MTRKLTTLPLAIGLLVGCGTDDQARHSDAGGTTALAEGTDVALKLPAGYKRAGPYMISD